MAFFFFGPSRVLGCAPGSPLSFALSEVRLRFAVDFFLGSEAEPEGTGVVLPEFEEEEGKEGCCATGGSTELIAGAIGW